MVELERMAGVAHAGKPRAAADLLDGALREGGGIGEAPVVEDVIDVEAGDACTDAVEGLAVEGRGIDISTQAGVAQLIVGTGAAIKEVDAYLRAVHAEVELAPAIVEVEFAQLKTIAQEHPFPAGIGA